jgi:hypothetical protein
LSSARDAPQEFEAAGLEHLLDAIVDKEVADIVEARQGADVAATPADLAGRVQMLAIEHIGDDGM